jgi:cell division protein FtsQ
MNSGAMNSHLANDIFDSLKSKEHIHMYKARKTKLSEFIITLILTVTVVWSSYYLADPATLPIKQVRIEGEFRQLSTAALQALVKHKVRGGFFNINVTAVKDAVMAEPWVRGVSVHRVWPDSLRVSVKEQIAVARWGDTDLLNSKGKLFSPEKKSFPIGLPVLRGPNGTEELVMAKYTQLKQSLSAQGLNVVLLQLNERRSWMFELDNSIQVIIGRSEFNDRVKRFIEYVPAGYVSRYLQIKQVDMRYTNGFAVSWRQGGAMKNGKSGA